MFWLDCNSVGEPFGPSQGQRDETFVECMAVCGV
jgi:hypothetical protein